MDMYMGPITIKKSTFLEITSESGHSRYEHEGWAISKNFQRKQYRIVLIYY